MSQLCVVVFIKMTIIRIYPSLVITNNTKTLSIYFIYADPHTYAVYGATRMAIIIIPPASLRNCSIFRRHHSSVASRGLYLEILIIHLFIFNICKFVVTMIETSKNLPFTLIFIFSHCSLHLHCLDNLVRSCLLEYFLELMYVRRLKTCFGAWLSTKIFTFF